MNDAKIWTLARSQYQAGTGVHRPYIGEISPWQYSSLSKRGRTQYDAKRAREWSASAAVADNYARRIIEAYDAGEYDAAGSSSDARTIIFAEEQRREQEAAEARFQELRRSDGVTFDTCEIGDRVHVCGRYGRIVKKSAKSCRIELENCPYITYAVKHDYSELRRHSYNDLRQEAGL